MSAEPPSASEQACPRSVTLRPDGLLVPAATLRVLLRGGRTLPLRYTGFGLEPWVRDGEDLAVEAARAVTRGDLLLCDRGGWGDLLRAVRPAGAGGWVVRLDAYPRRTTAVPAEAILGTVTAVGGRTPRRLAARFAAAGGLGAACFAWRRIERAPAWEGEAGDTVLEKYRAQVPAYRAARQSNLTAEQLADLARYVKPGGRILVCGCGAGGEVVHLARQGYQVTGVDAVTEMIDAARQVLSEEKVEARLEVADLRTLDLAERPFDAIYLTPLLYSFLPGRDRRIGVLRRLGRHLGPGGCVLYSARIHRGTWSRLQTRLAWARRPTRSGAGEPGDWYTWFLTPKGTIGYSFLRRFGAAEVAAEGRAAGFRTLLRRDSHFLAADPEPA